MTARLSEKRGWWNKKARFVRYLARPASYSVGVALSTALGLLSIGALRAPTFTLVLFLEGGLGLLLGVAIALSSTPYISRVGESLLQTAPWSREAEKNAENVGLRWMLASTFLILIGFIVSTMS